MARELKFRAWDKEQSVMLSHEEVDQLDKDGIAHWMDIIKPDNKDGFVVMQYTGLKDKNGKEIYEGDIISCEISGDRDLQFSVHFGETFELMKPEEGYYGWYCKYIGGSYPDIKEHHCQLNSSSTHIAVIIGNIHENPELL